MRLFCAARANEGLPDGPSWLDCPGGFGYTAIGMGGGPIVPGGPMVLDGPYMKWYGTIYDESDPRYRFGANPASSFSNEGTFASWISKWSLKK